MIEKLEAGTSDTVQTMIPWEDKAKDLLTTEMKRCKVGYKQLSRMLEAYGIEESAGQINRKVNRKRFSAAFLIACLSAMGVETIALTKR
ncbi:MULTISPECIES: DUF6471 domain-containing protein [Deefgea]|uniref:DUF6471 domain-containing protein n=1 Tax=Deefgea chitinilytica TaxID=570276 RepID=A0ABS2CAC3_9NEIS|nr:MULTISPECIES: DUF6471 domain-containing protein [Deefgea]MBM5571094.1 hypothetical protein [Deefgea chitinilytica]MBM9888324.1 hypothetical protein [Deefgea sp. CFH1-16]